LLIPKDRVDQVLDNDESIFVPRLQPSAYYRHQSVMLFVVLQMANLSALNSVALGTVYVPYIMVIDAHKQSVLVYVI